jgi:16S rRNA (cytosine1402-N4)-methyltransferase
MKTQHSVRTHIPVLVDEVLEYLKVMPDSTYIDATFGAGGHTRAILEQEPTCNVVALDWDKKALETYGELLKQEFGNRLSLVWGNFAHLYKVIRDYKEVAIAGILADFGTSQDQIFRTAGLSVYRDTPLDMRMSPAHQKVTAAEIIAHFTERELRDLFWEYGQERYTKQIVSAIIRMRSIQTLRTTKQLAQLIERVVPVTQSNIHPATRVFQALRIYVNKELDNITSFLKEAVRILMPEGRLVCISFHSLEDRLVKQFFKEQADVLHVKQLTLKGITASKQEVFHNASARSARLRAVQKL